MAKKSEWSRGEVEAFIYMYTGRVSYETMSIMLGLPMSEIHKMRTKFIY